MKNLNNAHILTYLPKIPTMNNYPSAPTELTVRRLSVDLSQGFSRHWNGGDAFLTAYANALSMSFPVGEQSFIDAIKAGAKQLPDTPENAELIVLRAARLRVSRALGAGRFLARGIVRDVAYLGDFHDIEIDAAGASIRVIRPSSEAIPAPGEECFLSGDDDAIAWISRSPELNQGVSA